MSGFSPHNDSHRVFWTISVGIPKCPLAFFELKLLLCLTWSQHSQVPMWAHIVEKIHIIRNIPPQIIDRVIVVILDSAKHITMRQNKTLIDPHMSNLCRQLNFYRYHRDSTASLYCTAYLFVFQTIYLLLSCGAYFVNIIKPCISMSISVTFPIVMCCVLLLTMFLHPSFIFSNSNQKQIVWCLVMCIAESR